jgi:hypothetical protein
MTRSSFAARTGPILMRTPSYRQQALRRRLMVMCAVLGLALASGVLGSLATAPPARTAAATIPAATGPFSYFPSE